MGEDSTLIELVTRCESGDEFIERFARFTTETDVVVPAVPHVRVGSAGRFTIRLKDRSPIMTGQCEVVELRPVAVAPGANAAAAARALMRLRVSEMDARSCGIHLRLMERHAAVSKPAPPPAPAPAPAPPRPPVLRTPARSLTLVRGVVPPSAPVAIAGELPGPPVAPAIPTPASTIQVMSIPRPPPLRSAPGPGALAATPTLAPADAIVVAMASASESEPTQVSPEPRQETRVEGAAFTLPANPLSDLDAADLASFVDLTLLETSAAADAPSEPAFERPRRIARRVAPYAACVLAGLLLGMVFRPGSKPAPATPPTHVDVPAAPAPPPAVPPPTEATQPPAVVRCVASVTTTPPGAAVLWGSAALGTSPIESAAIPCGPAVVTLRHERYAEVTRTVTAEHGRDAVITERLSRPSAKLLVVSSPPNAVIKLNNHSFGPAPRKIGTLRFEHLRLQASLPGYQPWRKTVYLKEAETTLEVKLTPVPKPAPRRPPPPPAPATRR